MNIDSRIIICGPTCSGKNYLKNKYLERGFKCDVSYTTRKPRFDEMEGVDYYFLTVDEFNKKIKNDEFYEWIEYEGTKYGTGKEEWNTCDIFIMETVGISKLTKEDRNKSFIIYLNPQRLIRENRMRTKRMWIQRQVTSRAKQDFTRFSNFNDFDMEITNAEF